MGSSAQVPTLLSECSGMPGAERTKAAVFATQHLFEEVGVICFRHKEVIRCYGSAITGNGPTANL